MRENRGQVIAALDVGSTKVVMAIATYAQGELEVIGIGRADNTGVRQGQIVHMAETQEAILKAKEEAELMAGQTVQTVYLSVAGGGVQSHRSSGMIPIKGEQATEADIQAVLDMACAIRLPEESQILHALPLSFKVDEQEGVTNPLNMKGVRLEVEAQLLTIPKAKVENLLSCVEKAGLKIKHTVLDSYAVALSSLLEDERHAGVAVVEVGGGTSDIIVFKEGKVTHVGSIPVGGVNFTQDVAVGLKTPVPQAESIKKKEGTALVDMVSSDEVIEIASLGERPNRTIPRLELTRILEARAEETLSLIFQQFNNWDVVKDLPAGVVLSGGGSLLPGLLELSEFTFDIPVRRATPKNILGMRETYNSPVYSTVIGTLLFGSEREKHLFPKKKTTKKSKKDFKSPTWEEIKRLMTKALSI